MVRCRCKNIAKGLKFKEFVFSFARWNMKGASITLLNLICGALDEVEQHLLSGTVGRNLWYLQKVVTKLV